MFSLRMLLAVVALSAVYIACFLFRTEWWKVAILTLTYLIFASAITAAFLSRERRAFFLAFAVYGLVYGLCVYLRVELVTERLLTNWARTTYQAEVDARRQTASDATAQTATAGRPGLMDAAGTDVVYENPFDDPPPRSPFGDEPRQRRNPFGDLDDTLSHFRSVGHSFFALLVGFVAGVVAEAVVRRKSHASSSAAKSSGT
jgi:hypothetical protein